MKAILPNGNLIALLDNVALLSEVSDEMLYKDLTLVDPQAGKVPNNVKAKGGLNRFTSFDTEFLPGEFFMSAGHRVIILDPDNPVVRNYRMRK